MSHPDPVSLEIEPSIPDPNIPNAFLTTKPVDFVGSNGLVYQNATSTARVKRKLADMPDTVPATATADTIAAEKMAKEIIAVENVYGHNSFRFTVSAGDITDPKLHEAIEAVNIALASFSSSRELSISDFILLPFAL